MNTSRNAVATLLVDAAKPGELVVSYKAPCSVSVLDMRSTRVSSITGKKVPGVVGSHTLWNGGKHAVAMQPFFTEVGAWWSLKGRTRW